MSTTSSALVARSMRSVAGPRRPCAPSDRRRMSVGGKGRVLQRSGGWTRMYQRSERQHARAVRREAADCTATARLPVARDGPGGVGEHVAIEQALDQIDLVADR